MNFVTARDLPHHHLGHLFCGRVRGEEAGPRSQIGELRGIAGHPGVSWYGSQTQGIHLLCEG